MTVEMLLHVVYPLWIRLLCNLVQLTEISSKCVEQASKNMSSREPESSRLILTRVLMFTSSFTYLLPGRGEKHKELGKRRNLIAQNCRQESGIGPKVWIFESCLMSHVSPVSMHDGCIPHTLKQVQVKKYIKWVRGNLDWVGGQWYASGIPLYNILDLGSDSNTESCHNSFPIWLLQLLQRGPKRH